MKKTILTLSILTILLYACKDENIINTPEQTSTQASQDHLLQKIHLTISIEWWKMGLMTMD